MSKIKEIKKTQSELIEEKLREDLSETFPAGSFDLFLQYLNAKNTASKHILRKDYKIEREVANDTLITTPLEVSVESGKFYRLKACFISSVSSTDCKFLIIESKDKPVNNKNSLLYFQTGSSVLDGSTIRDDDFLLKIQFQNNGIGYNNRRNSSLFVEGVVEAKQSGKLALELLKISGNDEIVIHKGSYIELEEI